MSLDPSVISVARRREAVASTISAFTADNALTGHNFEERGPSTTIPNVARRIPFCAYKLRWNSSGLGISQVQLSIVI